MRLFEFDGVGRAIVHTTRFSKDAEKFAGFYPQFNDSLRAFVEHKRFNDGPFNKKDGPLMNGDLRGYRHAHLVHGRAILIYQIAESSVRLIAVDEHEVITGVGRRVQGLSKYLAGLRSSDFSPFIVEDFKQPLTYSEKQDIINTIWDYSVDPKHRKIIEALGSGNAQPFLAEAAILIPRASEDESIDAIRRTIGTDELSKIAKESLSHMTLSEMFKTPVERFMDDYNANTQPNALNQRSRIFNERTILDVSPSIQNRNGIHISDINTTAPNKGDGSRALQFLIDLADKHGVALDLFAKAYEKGRLTTKQLIAWYERHGFAVMGNSDRGWVRMEKPAKGSTAPSQSDFGGTEAEDDPNAPVRIKLRGFQREH